MEWAALQMEDLDGSSVALLVLVVDPLYFVHVASPVALSHVAEEFPAFDLGGSEER